MIEESSALARCYSEFLSKEDTAVTIIKSAKEAEEYFSTHSAPEVILLDIQLRHADGTALLEHILNKSPQSIVVVINGSGSFELSRQVMKHGAFDYLEKPFTRDRLCVTMRNALRQLELVKATYQLQGADSVNQENTSGNGGIFGLPHKKAAQQDPELAISPLWQVEMEAIERAIRICSGNITQAARFLEINPSTIHRKRQAWGKNGQA